LILAEHRKLYWINQFAEGNLAIMAAARSDELLEATILAWQNEGVDIVVCLLEQPEMPNLIEAERAFCEELGLEFFSFPIRDKTVPDSIDAFANLTRQLAGRIAAGKSVAIHCRAGIGRSTMLAACVLIQFGIDAAVGLDMIAAARGTEVPETEAQRQWILSFGQTAQLQPASFKP
jgi:hypothetical protein